MFGRKSVGRSGIQDCLAAVDKKGGFGKTAATGGSGCQKAQFITDLGLGYGIGDIFPGSSVAFLDGNTGALGGDIWRQGWRGFWSGSKSRNVGGGYMSHTVGIIFRSKSVFGSEISIYLDAGDSLTVVIQIMGDKNILIVNNAGTRVSKSGVGFHKY